MIKSFKKLFNRTLLTKMNSVSFKTLKREYENAKIIDNRLLLYLNISSQILLRNHNDPIHNMVITCEHASNEYYL